jgi:insulysin
VPNPKEINSCLVYQCEVGEVSQRELLSVNSLLIHMMREPTFDELRTKQQLGYIAYLTRMERRGKFGLRFTIQSEREPVYLESRVEDFLRTYREQLLVTKPDEFDRQKEGLIAAKLQKLENLYSETQRFWSHIGNGYFDFRRRSLCLFTMYDKGTNYLHQMNARWK